MYNQNPFNPYQMNPAYANQINNNIRSVNPYQIIKVNGRGGADAFQMPPNAQALLLDETQPILWLKQTDGAGYPTVTAYDIKPHEEAPMPDMRNLEERISKIEEAMKHESNYTSNGRKVTDAVTSTTDGADNKVLR